MTRAAVVLMLVVVGLGVATAGARWATGAATALPASSGSHIVVIVMENKESGDVLGNAESP